MVARYGGPLARGRSEHPERRGEGFEHLVVDLLRAQRVVRVTGTIDPERGIEHGALPQRRPGEACEFARVAEFGHQQRRAVRRIALEVLGDRSGIAVVDVGREGIDMRRAGAPDRQRVPVRPARGTDVAAFVAESIAERRVDVHRQILLGLAGHRHGVDVAGEMPAGEELVGALAERLTPGAGHPHRLCQLGGQRGVEQPVRLGRMVAGEAVAAGLVLDLDHDHRVLGIGLAQVPHQGGEGAGVGGQGLTPQRAQDIVRAAVFLAHPREALAVALDPFRRVGRRGVLERAVPQQHETLVMGTRAFEQRIDKAEIELTFGGFELLPGHGHFQGIGAHPVERRPHRGKNGGIVRAVVGLHAERQERLPVDNQDGVNRPPIKVRQWGIRWRRAEREGRHHERQDSLSGAQIPLLWLRYHGKAAAG